MAKAIYALKIVLFRDQFKLTAKEDRGLLDLCSILLNLYVRQWLTAPQAISAPRRDLALLKGLIQGRSQTFSFGGALGSTTVGGKNGF